MSKKKINLLNDYLFKAWFRSIETRPLASMFLSKVTGYPKEIFMNANYVGGELIKENIEEKGKMSDVIVKIDDHNQLIIEMNQYYQPNIFDKNTSYAYNLYNINKRGKIIPEIILINIDNFNYYKTNKPILDFKIRSEEGIIENESYHSIHLILDNLNNNIYNLDKEIYDFLEFLKYTDITKMKKDYKGRDEYMESIKKLEDLILDPANGLVYDIEERHQEELEAMEEWAKTEGIEAGKKIGIEAGRKEGIEQGIEQAKKESIIKFSKNGVSKEIISKSLNVSIEEIELILKKEE